MPESLLQQLGVSKEEILEMVVKRLVEEITTEEEGYFSRVMSKAHQQIQQHIDGSVASLFEKHVRPMVERITEGICLQETNRWGEKTGKSLTFIEYLVSRTEQYIREEVNYEGKDRSQDSYNWKKAQTRIGWMVDKHLQYAISTAMEKALRSINSVIAEGLAETVKIKLQEVTNGLTVAVGVKK